MDREPSTRQKPASPSGPEDTQLAEVLDRNIHLLVERRRREDDRRKFSERLAEGITRFSGNLIFAWLHLAIFGTWIVINLGWTSLKPFDPDFVILAMIASVEALFLSTFVLIAQNRMAAAADKRADLDLQISLLAEHEITHLITLVSAIAKHLKLEQADHPELRELKRDVHPERVLDSLEKENAEPAGGKETASRS